MTSTRLTFSSRDAESDVSYQHLGDPGKALRLRALLLLSAQLLLQKSASEQAKISILTSYIAPEVLLHRVQTTEQGSPRYLLRYTFPKFVVEPMKRQVLTQGPSLTCAIVPPLTWSPRRTEGEMRGKHVKVRGRWTSEVQQCFQHRISLFLSP